ncbi:hypothetical protein DERP_014542 [Dermatophagoides pteronyssinus]|uniref:Uncharacterized protein n=1 Tax=Dermatophagoides pteronyssinus TaxID=6956 RepID=A0ABQ8J1U0_DERPT|nr:hypothetical protein DERP_014542 [Dermatophagoides pteronyssinus]
MNEIGVGDFGSIVDALFNINILWFIHELVENLPEHIDYLFVVVVVERNLLLQARFEQLLLEQPVGSCLLAPYRFVGEHLKSSILEY